MYAYIYHLGTFKHICKESKLQRYTTGLKWEKIHIWNTECKKSWLKKSFKSTWIAPLIHSHFWDEKGVLNSVNRLNVVALGTSVGKTDGSSEPVSPLWLKCFGVWPWSPEGELEGKKGGFWHSLTKARQAWGSSSPLTGAQAGGHGCTSRAAVFRVCGGHTRRSTSTVRQQKRCCQSTLCGMWNVWSGEGALMQN